MGRKPSRGGRDDYEGDLSEATRRKPRLLSSAAAVPGCPPTPAVASASGFRRNETEATLSRSVRRQCRCRSMVETRLPHSARRRGVGNTDEMRVEEREQVSVGRREQRQARLVHACCGSPAVPARLLLLCLLHPARPRLCGLLLRRRRGRLAVRHADAAARARRASSSRCTANGSRKSNVNSPNPAVVERFSQADMLGLLVRSAPPPHQPDRAATQSGRGSETARRPYCQRSSSPERRVFAGRQQVILSKQQCGVRRSVLLLLSTSGHDQAIGRAAALRERAAASPPDGRRRVGLRARVRR
jgi:hypothetical protein